MHQPSRRKAWCICSISPRLSNRCKGDAIERARRSPTSISKVLIPGSRQLVAILLQMTENIANFMDRKPGVDRDTQIMKPKLGFFIAAAHMNVRGLTAFIIIKEGPVRSPA